MNLSTKILLWLSAVLILGGLLFIAIKQHEISQRQLAIQTQVVAQQQLANDIIRAQNEFATKADIEAAAKQSGIDLKTIQDNLNLLHAKVNGINTLTVHSTGEVDTNVKSTSTAPSKDPVATPTVECDGKQLTCPDPFGYGHSTQQLKLNEMFGQTQVPIGQAGFSAWRPAPWDLTIYPRQYSVTTVTGKDQEGREYVYNKVQIQSDGKTYDVKIDNSKFLQEYPTASFSWWNPRLYLGISAGLGLQTHNFDWAPSLNLGVMSYGKYTIQPDWTFLNLGIGWAAQNSRPIFELTPFTYNVGKSFPLMHNVYIGPTLAADTVGTVYTFGTIQLGL